MGIESFFGAYILPKYRSCIRKNNNKLGKISSLMIDCNGIFHNSAQKIYGYGKYSAPMLGNQRTLLLEDIIVKLDEIITTISPEDNFILAPDGVAPVAKLNQQKSRRFLSSAERTIEFDSNQFTPGTKLMMDIDKYIDEWIYKSENLPRNTIYSSHNEKGEGEHKIFEFARQGKIKGNGSHVLYGLDSDLIILSLLSPLEKIYLMREDYSSVVDIQILRKLIKTEFEFKGCDQERLLKDFSVIVMFAGNDFLPKLPSFTETRDFIEQFTIIYKSNKEHIIDSTNKINFRVLMKLFEKYDERYNLEKVINEDLHAYPYNEILESMSENDIDMKLFEAKWYNKQFKPRTNELNKFYKDKKYFDGSDIAKMCIEYLKTMGWVYRYYTDGHLSVSNTHFYPYIYAPMADSIKTMLEKLFKDDKKMPERLQRLHDVDQHFFEITSNHQLMMVLPPKSIDIIPYKLRKVYTKYMTCINPKNFLIAQEGTNKDWHKTAIIPPVNLNFTRLILENI